MKTTFKVILIVLVATFYSCEKNEVPQVTNSSITSDGVLSGTIVDSTGVAIDSIDAETYDNSQEYPTILFIGRSGVANNNKFSMSLSIPNLSLGRIGSGFGGVTISDTTALGNSITNIYLYKGRNQVGQLIKCNYTSVSLRKLGMTYSRFTYVDRVTTIKGAHTQLGRYGIYGYVDTLKYVYNVTLKKGWNEMVYKIEKMENTKMGVTTTRSVTNDIPSDLQLRYFPNNTDFNYYNFMWY